MSVCIQKVGFTNVHRSTRTYLDLQRLLCVSFILINYLKYESAGLCVISPISQIQLTKVFLPQIKSRTEITTHKHVQTKSCVCVLCCALTQVRQRIDV